MSNKIKKNAARCKGCGFLLVSTHVHDFRSHKCIQPRIAGMPQEYYFFVDGGKSYLRRGWGGSGMSHNPDDHYEEASEYFYPMEGENAS